MTFLPGMHLFWVLASPSADYVQKDRQDNAQQQRRGEREVESGVLAAVEDVSGQASERQVGAADQRKEEAGDHQHDSNDDE